MSVSEIIASVGEIDWGPVWISLRVGFSATAISLVVGTIAGWLMASREFPGRRWAMALVMLPLVLPPTVLGYYLLVLIGSDGVLGEIWQAVFGAPLVFTIKAAILAACVSTIPIVARQLAAAFAETDQEVTEAALIDGAGTPALFLHIHLPQIRQPLIAAGTIAFARAIGDFGATLMVAGNIPGRTQTASIAIWDLMNSGNETQALILVILISLVSLLVLVLTTGKTMRSM